MRGMIVLLATLLATGASRSDPAHGAQIDLPGVKLWYTDTGGKGAPIVLLHANTGTSAPGRQQNDVFSKAGYRVIAFDRRGWGKASPTPRLARNRAPSQAIWTRSSPRLKLDRSACWEPPAAASRRWITPPGIRIVCAA